MINFKGMIVMLVLLIGSVIEINSMNGKSTIQIVTLVYVALYVALNYRTFKNMI